MAYKTFAFRNGFQAWSNRSGEETTLFGGIYDYGVAPSFRKVKVVKLVERADKPSVIKDDTWTIQADLALQAECRKMFAHNEYHQRPELIIEGRGRNIDTMFAFMGASSD